MEHQPNTPPHHLHKEATLVSLLYDRHPFRANQCADLRAPGLFVNCPSSIFMQGAEEVFDINPTHELAADII